MGSTIFDLKLDKNRIDSDHRFNALIDFLEINDCIEIEDLREINGLDNISADPYIFEANSQYFLVLEECEVFDGALRGLSPVFLGRQGYIWGQDFISFYIFSPSIAKTSRSKTMV